MSFESLLKKLLMWQQHTYISKHLQPIGPQFIKLKNRYSFQDANSQLAMLIHKGHLNACVYLVP